MSSRPKAYASDESIRPYTLMRGSAHAAIFRKLECCGRPLPGFRRVPEKSLPHLCSGFPETGPLPLCRLLSRLHLASLLGKGGKSCTCLAGNRSVLSANPM